MGSKPTRWSVWPCWQKYSSEGAGKVQCRLKVSSPLRARIERAIVEDRARNMRTSSIGHRVSSAIQALFDFYDIWWLLKEPFFVVRSKHVTRRSYLRGSLGSHRCHGGTRRERSGTQAIRSAEWESVLLFHRPVEGGQINWYFYVSLAVDGAGGLIDILLFYGWSVVAGLIDMLLFHGPVEGRRINWYFRVSLAVDGAGGLIDILLFHGWLGRAD